MSTQQHVLALDIGGTKLEAAIVDQDGKILTIQKVILPFENGKEAVIQSILDTSRELLALENNPNSKAFVSAKQKKLKIKKIGIASAGPLDPLTGTLLNPTNFFSEREGHWGKTPLKKIIEKNLNKHVTIDNDAACAVLAERWIGYSKKYLNSAVVTLGTGLGTGFIVNGRLARSGQHLHTEGGHLIIEPHDRTHPCGCGNYGCAEALLSGKNFLTRARILLNQKQKLSSLTHEEFKNFLEDTSSPFHDDAHFLIQTYSDHMAIFLHNCVVTFGPELICFSGSFASFSNYFLKSTEQKLSQLLQSRRRPIDLVPRLRLSRLKNHSSLLGAAHIAISGHDATAQHS
jgi:glucokinase